MEWWAECMFRAGSFALILMGSKQSWHNVLSLPLKNGPQEHCLHNKRKLSAHTDCSGLVFIVPSQCQPNPVHYWSEHWGKCQTPHTVHSLYAAVVSLQLFGYLCTELEVVPPAPNNKVPGLIFCTPYRLQTSWKTFAAYSRLIWAVQRMKKSGGPPLEGPMLQAAMLHSHSMAREKGAIIHVGRS